MLKKSLTMITLLCAMVPMAAYAASWSLATRVSTVGGTLSSRNATVQTSVNGTVFKTYTTTKTSVPVTIAADAGYAISAVSINGVAQAIPYTGSNPVSMGLAVFPGKSAQAVVVSFSAKTQLIAVTTKANDGGTVTPAGTFQVKPGSVASVTFKPNAGNTFAGVTPVTGVTFKTTNSYDAKGNQLSGPVLDVNGNPTGAVKVAFTVPTAAMTVAGNFTLGLGADAGPGQSVTALNVPVALAGTVTGSPDTILWTQTAGPTVAIVTPNSAAASFTPTELGTYNFMLTATKGTATKTSVTYVNVVTAIPAQPVATVRTLCVTCHTSAGVGSASLYQNWSSSLHNNNTHERVQCYDCHVGANTGGHPGENPYKGCANCHKAPYAAFPDGSAVSAADAVTCAGCHGGTSKDIHAASTPTETSCIACHDVAIKHPGNVVFDNNGVRAITGEFAKWSHHVTGVELQDAHCAACHLEGEVAGGKIVPSALHMADNKTHLRNADDDSDMQWDPAAPSFSTMDNFCLSCHDGNGAVSTGSAAIRAIIIPASGKTASATNPFGDTISNQYDLLERPAVVDAAGQFATGNPSHHAVLGKRYSGRTRTIGDARKVDESSAAFNSNSSASLPGKRSTIFDAGKFQADYTTLVDADGETGLRNGGSSLGDDSTLHCGDCHTVGQFRAADAAPGNRYNKVVIGAHGSNNEYLLRNNIGTDARHQGVETTGGTAGVPSNGYGTKPYLVCFNCHAFTTYGSVGGSTAMAGLNHAGEYANSTRCNGPYNTVFGNMTGEGRLDSMTTRTDATGTTGYGKPQGSLFGNVFGIQCANCHNSGVSAGNIFGGIHGSKDQTYTDGMGNTTKHYRFMPGLGNIMFVPGTKGGFEGGSLAAYNSYSGNRDGSGTSKTTGQTYTTLPYRTIVGAVPTFGTQIDGKSAPNQFVYNTTATVFKTGSYQYTTGGVSSDLNWEQKSQQPVANEFDYQAKAMGCYTVAPTAVKVVGQNGDADKYPAAADIEAAYNGPNGTKEVFDNWGGCDDHNGAQGAGTGIYRKVLRKANY